MEPIANETWKSFMRSYYRHRLLMLLSSLGEAYVGQLARILRIPSYRVVALLEGDPDGGYSKELALVPLGLDVQRSTVGRGRAYEITAKGRRKARSIAAGSARRARKAAAPVHVETTTLRWSVDVTGERSPAWTIGDG